MLLANSQIITPCRFSGQIKEYYERAATCVLKHDAVVDWEEYEAIPAYSDPAVQRKDVTKPLVLALWDAGMLRSSAKEGQEYVDLFTVVKKDEPPPVGRVQRISFRILS